MCLNGLFTILLFLLYFLRRITSLLCLFSRFIDIAIYHLETKLLLSSTIKHPIRIKFWSGCMTIYCLPSNLLLRPTFTAIFLLSRYLRPTIFSKTPATFELCVQQLYTDVLSLQPDNFSQYILQPSVWQKLPDSKFLGGLHQAVL